MTEDCFYIDVRNFKLSWNLVVRKLDQIPIPKFTLIRIIIYMIIIKVESFNF